MTEEYLHQIWKNKRLPFHNLIPINASNICVKDVGVYNENQKGPDFQFGSVQIDDLDFYGNIEIHVKSSDWYKHKHDTDDAYNNVILHVVYEYDKPVIQNGFLIPTIELKSLIDLNHYESHVMKRVSKNEFPCARMLMELDPIYLESMKMKSFSERMDSKVNLLKKLRLSDQSIVYYLLANAFGTSINKEGFINLTQKVPFKQLRRLTTSRQKMQLLLSESGLIQNTVSSVGVLWHFKGTRPKNFPTIRIKQFAHFVSCYDFDTTFTHLDSKEIITEFQFMIESFWSKDNCDIQKISKAFSNSLLINTIVPFLWLKSDNLDGVRLKDKAIELLEMIPPEKNKFTDIWKRHKIKLKNSFDSQSLLSLYQYYCINKKCSTCNVGVKLLE